METTLAGKVNATVNADKADFSDIESAFGAYCIVEDYNTVILFNTDTAIYADKE